MFLHVLGCVEPEFFVSRPHLPLPLPQNPWLYCNHSHSSLWPEVRGLTGQNTLFLGIRCICLGVSGGFVSSPLISGIPDSFYCAHLLGCVLWLKRNLASPPGTTELLCISALLSDLQLWSNQQDRLSVSCNCTLIIKWAPFLEQRLLARNFSKSFLHTIVHTLHPRKCILNIQNR